MKKLTAILKKSGLQEELIPIREKEISRLIEDCKDFGEAHRIRKQVKFESMLNLLGDESANLRDIFKELLELRVSINSADSLDAAVADLEKELNKEVEEPKVKSDNE